MAKKKADRKKQLRREMAALRKAGRLFADGATKKAGKAKDTVVEKVQDVVEIAKEHMAETVEAGKKSAGTFEAFAKELEGVTAARLETFYAEGIQSAKDFLKWTERELLALKGIGPATIKQLKELGVKFKS